ncbi:MAG: leucyl/phenylalanyl-tRNA--protein transferase, partial [Proteobacteria bacterium]|nr:leucyl/phenylalanyl-tRNA--protein transferase [Pseudomonadota bacterium]
NQADYQLIDCQVTSEHLLSLGAEEIPRVQFIELLQMYTKTFMLNKNWLD